MKARFFVDLYPHQTNATIGTFPLFASTVPSGTKPEGATRVAFDVDLPDPGVDAVTQGKNVHVVTGK